MRNTARQHNYPTNSDNASAKIKFQTDMKHQSEASQERHKPSHPSPMQHQPRLASPPMSDTKTESGFAMPKTKSPSPQVKTMPAESTSKRLKHSDDGNMCLLSPAIISDTRSQQSRSNSNSCLSRSYKNHALIDKFSKILEEEKQQ